MTCFMSRKWEIFSHDASRSAKPSNWSVTMWSMASENLPDRVRVRAVITAKGEVPETSAFPLIVDASSACPADGGHCHLLVK